MVRLKRKPIASPMRQIRIHLQAATRSVPSSGRHDNLTLRAVCVGEVVDIESKTHRCTGLVVRASGDTVPTCSLCIFSTSPSPMTSVLHVLGVTKQS